MADSGLQTMTGNDEFLFDAAHHVAFIAFYTDTPTVEVDYRSIHRPRRQLHAGWVALASGNVGEASDDIDLSGIGVTWWSYFDFESMLIVNPSNFDYDDRVIWNIPTGITAKFTAIYA